MKYLKLYESFTLPRYENDYRKIISYKEEIIKKRNDLNDMNDTLNKMEMKINKDHNLSKMLESIFDKLHNYLMETDDSWDKENEKDILEFVPKSKSILGNGVNMIYISIYNPDKEDYQDDLIEEVIWSDEWVFRNYDEYGDPINTSFNDIEPNVLYKIIKVLMSDEVISSSINKKLFNDINEGFVNKILISTLLGIGALRGYPQSNTLINKQIEQKIEMIDTDVNINDTINFINNNSIILGQKYDMDTLDELFYNQFNRNLKDVLHSLVKSSSPISVQIFTFDNKGSGLIDVPIININLHTIEKMKISFFDSGWGDNYYNVFGIGVTKTF